MKRHRTNLESKAHQNEQTAQIEQRQVGDARYSTLYLKQAGGTRGAVDQGDAVDQDAGDERADQEVLHGRFRRAGRATPRASQDVGPQRHGLHTQKHRHKVRGLNQNDHADDGKKHQRVVLAEVHLVLSQVSWRAHQAKQRSHDAHAAHQQTKAVYHQHVAIDVSSSRHLGRLPGS